MTRTILAFVIATLAAPAFAWGVVDVPSQWPAEGAFDTAPKGSTRSAADD